MSENFPQSPIIILDEDWAPDFVLEEVINIFESHHIKTTWFITHLSDALSSLQGNPSLFELGIHPNFFPNSTQGGTQEEIISHCLDIVPDAKCMRTHAYAQSSLLYKYIAENTSIECDASVFIPHTYYLQPFQYWIGDRSIYRAPVFWEDDNAMKIPGNKWGCSLINFQKPGLKVFAFHPIHIYLNTSKISDYDNLKNAVPKLSEANRSDFDQFIQRENPGVKDFLLEMIKIIAADSERESFTLSEIIANLKGSIHE